MYPLKLQSKNVFIITLVCTSYSCPIPVFSRNKELKTYLLINFQYNFVPISQKLIYAIDGVDV